MALHRTRRALVAGVALPALLAGAVPLALSGAGPASAAPSGPEVRPVHTVHRHVSDRARAAGIDQQGGGRMGWSAPASASPAAASAETGPSPQVIGTHRRSFATQATGVTYGIDVSRYQGSVSWASYYGQGKRFAYVKATEGSTYTSPTFSAQYTGAASAGLIRGAYHFANPSGASGATQAQFFVSHGGGWSADGKTLPGVLDIEYNPYSGGTCYGLSQAAMRSWISSFTTKYKALTGRDAVIYSTTDWWKTCTGNTAAFAATNPLWIARYNTTVGTLPAGWGYYTFWQYSSSPIDQDRFNGSITGLRKLATG